MSRARGMVAGVLGAVTLGMAMKLLRLSTDSTKVFVPEASVVAEGLRTSEPCAKLVARATET